MRIITQFKPVGRRSRRITIDCSRFRASPGLSQRNGHFTTINSMERSHEQR